MTMKLIDDIIMTPMGDDWVAVPTGEASEVLHGIVRINATAKLLWDGLEQNLGEQELVKLLTDHYDVSESTAAQSVARILGELKGAGLIED